MVRARWRTRSGVLAAVCVGHVGLILLLTNTSSGYRQRGGVGAMEQEPMLLVLIDELLREREHVDAETGVSNSARPAPLDDSIAPSVAPDFDIVEPITSSDEGLAPRLDWSAEAKRSAAGAVESQIARDALVAQSREKLSGHPKGMELPPPESRDRRLGDTEHYEGGETITWINSRCYYSTLAPLGPGAGQLSFVKPICKSRSRKSLPSLGTKAEREERSIPYQGDRNAIP